MEKKSILLICLFLAAGATVARGQNMVVVDKGARRLVVVGRGEGDTLLSCPVAIGANTGQKWVGGDMRTPEGIFPIVSVEDASHWKHDFGDGRGPRARAYGRWFIRLGVEGFVGIGIHGTCFPETVGTCSSEGCIRMLDDDLARLVRLVGKGDVVVILPDPTVPPPVWHPIPPADTIPQWRQPWGSGAAFPR